jgi:hypothetical protein
MWIFIAIGITTSIVLTISWSRERGRRNDLGGVSNLWLAEHRHAETQHPRR